MANTQNQRTINYPHVFDGQKPLVKMARKKHHQILESIDGSSRFSPLKTAVLHSCSFDHKSI